MADQSNTMSPPERYATMAVSIDAVDALSMSIRTTGALLRALEVPSARDQSYLFNAALEAIERAEDALPRFHAVREEEV